jgi:glycosyltransferase involved in cell wall biosynthesis
MLSVVIPCYNEEDNIDYIISRSNEIVSSRSDVQIILVDNGSTDNSLNKFKHGLANTNDRIILHEIKKNKGYGFGILSGLKAAKGEVLAWTHADMQTDPLDIITAYEIYLDQSNEDLLVKGRRKNRKIIESFFTWGMEIYVLIKLGIRLTDINAQPKLFSRTFYEKTFTNPPHDFSLDLYLLYWANMTGSIKEFPVLFNKRLYGEAKGGGGFFSRNKLIRRTLRYINKLKIDIAKNN